jgi:hypothetical protein
MIDYPVDSDAAHSEEHKEAVNVAIDIAHQMTAQALDTAQHAIGFQSADRRLVLELAAANINAAAIVYAAHVKADAMRELTPEVTGAISEAATDIGAGIALALEQALKTPNDDNHDNA